MKFFKLIGLIVLGLILVGCATPQLPVKLAADSFSTSTSSSEKIGIAMTSIPVADTYFPGADCLLCLVTANATNSTLSKYTKTLSVEELNALKVDIAAALKAKKNIDIVLIADSLDLKSMPDFPNSGPNIAKKDFTSLKTKYGVDKLLVVQVLAVGFTRPYASYIPTGAPKAMVSSTGFLVNLKTNTFEWYLPTQTIRGAEGNWDEPPQFPGLTNAYFQAVEQGRDLLINTLTK